MAEGQKSSLSTVPRQSWSIVRHRLQVGAARTSNAREVDSMREVIGLDLYNQCTTGYGGHRLYDGKQRLQRGNGSCHIKRRPAP